MRTVVALGGNAILQRGDRGTAAEQRSAIRESCEGLAALAAARHELVVTHGNGPQIGRLMNLNLARAGTFPPMPLDVLGAETQGALGYLVQSELAAGLARARVPRPVVTLVTRVVVDAADPAFVRPTKPVGPYLANEEASDLKARGVPVARAPDGGWRRVVPSPRPLEIVEREPVRALFEAGVVPVAAGGGGVPVVREGNSLRGVEAVVDKDLSAALLAEIVEAELLLVLSDVERVYLGFGTPQQRPLDRLTAADAREHLQRGEFPPGSMGPKIEAAVRVAEGGARAVITSLDRAVDAAAGRAGTEIVS